MTISVVVARYNEDIEWVQDIDPSHQIIVYNKSLEDIESPQVNVQIINNVANVGREAYSYVRYIVEHYDELPDVVVFLQGNPDDHIAWLSMSSSEFVNALINDALQQGVSAMTVFSCTETNGSYTIDEWYTPIKPSPIRPFGEWFKTYFGYELPCDPLRWIPGAQFAVRKDHILQHPRSFYVRLLRMIDHHVNPEEIYYLERSWYLMFK